MNNVTNVQLASQRQVGVSTALPQIPYFVILIYGILIVLAVVTLVPVVWMVLTAFKSPPEVAAIPPTWLPREWHPENFSLAWQYAPFGKYLMNTLFVAGSIMFLETTTSAC